MSKFKKDNEPVIIVNRDFRECILYIIFPIEDSSDAKIKVLEKMIFNKSAIYDTDKKIRDININNYCLSYHGKVTAIGNSYFLEMMLSFPSYNSLGKDVLACNLEFIKEIIYNPYLENGAFPEKDIRDIINIIKGDIKGNFKNVQFYLSLNNDKTIDEDDFLKDETDYNVSLFDEVTPKDIYELYKKTISKPPLVFLCGDVDKDNAKKEIERILLDNKISEVVFEKKYYRYAKNIPKEPIVVRDEYQYKSSGVYYNFKVRDLKSERDIAFLNIVRKLLDSNVSQEMYNYLRYNNDLAYQCGAYCYNTFGSMTIWTLTGKNNINKVEILYDEMMKKISDISFITEKLSLIKEKVWLNDVRRRENIEDLLLYDIDKYMECHDKTFYEYVKDIKPNEVKEFIDKRLVLVSKYIGVGEDDG